jgi:hypothetical protein
LAGNAGLRLVLLFKRVNGLDRMIEIADDSNNHVRAIPCLDTMGIANCLAEIAHPASLLALSGSLRADSANRCCWTMRRRRDSK